MSAQLGKWSWACVLVSRHMQSPCTPCLNQNTRREAWNPSWAGKEFPTTSLNIPGVNWELWGSTQTQQPLPFLQEPARAACIYREKTCILLTLHFWKESSNFNFIAAAKKVKWAAEGWILTMRSDHQNGLNWKPGVSLSKLQHIQERVQQVSSNVFPLFPFIPIFLA